MFTSIRAAAIAGCWRYWSRVGKAKGEEDDFGAVRLQLSIAQRARLLEAGWRRVVLLTFVERLLCGKDTNYEEWG